MVSKLNPAYRRRCNRAHTSQAEALESCLAYPRRRHAGFIRKDDNKVPADKVGGKTYNG
ncbi:hypothetical protein DL95DRAFT_386910 [Leptodontidium sp. 2 PMI_412]|nr:hypothetical protein DL95DRAFT_386910 [Leptodontidium sp. 2 PMI_412]